MYLHLAC